MERSFRIAECGFCEIPLVAPRGDTPHDGESMFPAAVASPEPAGPCAMTATVRIKDRLAIERLNADFAHQLDRGTADGFIALFTVDAVYVRGARVLRGRDALKDFYMSRTATAPRTSRHVVTGLRIDFESADRARGISVCTTFSMPGEPEIASTIPASVADFEDSYVRTDGVWLFAARNIVPIFTAAPAGG